MSVPNLNKSDVCQMCALNYPYPKELAAEKDLIKEVMKISEEINKWRKKIERDQKHLLERQQLQQVFASSEDDSCNCCLWGSKKKESRVIVIPNDLDLEPVCQQLTGFQELIPFGELQEEPGKLKQELLDLKKLKSQKDHLEKIDLLLKRVDKLFEAYAKRINGLPKSINLDSTAVNLDFAAIFYALAAANTHFPKDLVGDSKAVGRFLLLNEESITTKEFSNSLANMLATVCKIPRSLTVSIVIPYLFPHSIVFEKRGDIPVLFEISLHSECCVVYKMIPYSIKNVGDNREVE